MKIKIAYFITLLLSISSNGMLLAQENSTSFDDDITWNGEWSTKRESDTIFMIFIEMDKKVIGTYSPENGKIKGNINIETDQSVMTGTWKQTNAKGWLKLIMNDDKKSFIGEWGNKNDKTVKGNWTGKKIIEKFLEEKDIGILDLPYLKEKKGISYEKSLENWKELKQNNGNSYIYQSKFASWTGHGNTTQIEVRNGIVISRIYESYKRSEDGRKIIRRYIETKNDIGKHDYGKDAITIDELYKKALPYIKVDAKLNDIYFTTYQNGLLHFCGHYPKDCVDDCFKGVNICAIKWIK